MGDRLGVQRDDIGAVVRLLALDAEGAPLAELDADQAIDVGEALVRAGRELQTTQAELDAVETDADQATLDAAAEPEPVLSAALHREPRQVDVGDIRNPDDPLEW